MLNLKILMALIPTGKLKGLDIMLESERDPVDEDAVVFKMMTTLPDDTDVMEAHQLLQDIIHPYMVQLPKIEPHQLRVDLSLSRSIRGNDITLKINRKAS